MFMNKKRGMTAKEIKDMREQERIDDAYTPPVGMSLGKRRVLGALTAILLTAAILAVFAVLRQLLVYAQGYLTDYIPSDINKILPSNTVIALLNVIIGFLLFRATTKGIKNNKKNNGSAKITAIYIGYLSGIYLLPLLIIKGLTAFAHQTDNKFISGAADLLFSGLISCIAESDTAERAVFYILNILIIPLGNLLLYMLFTMNLAKGILGWIYKEPSEGIKTVILSTSLVLGIGMTLVVPYSLPLSLLQAIALTMLYHKTQSLWHTLAAYSSSMVIIFATMNIILNI